MEIKNILKTGYHVIVVTVALIVMEIKNILKTGYHVIVVTVALIEAFELGKNLIGKCNKKTVGVSDTAVDTNDVESA